MHETTPSASTTDPPKNHVVSRTHTAPALTFEQCHTLSSVIRTCLKLEQLAEHLHETTNPHLLHQSTLLTDLQVTCSETAEELTQLLLANFNTITEDEAQQGRRDSLTESHWPRPTPSPASPPSTPTQPAHSSEPLHDGEHLDE